MTYEQFMELAGARYSCRLYDTERAVDRETVEKLIEAARIAPSACNRQPWVFAVIDSEEGRDAVCASYEREWARTAPMFIVACGENAAAWHRPFDGKDHTDVDLSIAIQQICLAATTLGLGTCWICNFDPAVLRRGLNIPDGLEPIAVIPVGYPAAGTEVPAKRRKTAEEITRWGRF